MVKSGIRKLIFAVAFLSSTVLLGQGQSADFYRSSGKIYVVVAVIGAIFIGIIAFMIWLDIKIGKLESLNEEK